MQNLRALINFLALIVLLSGCGYSIQKSLSIESVRLGKIENATYEPKLQDRLAEALSVSLMKNGIRVDGSSPASVSGTIDRFELRSLSEKEGVTVSYEVIIRGRFFLDRPGGERRELPSRGLFLVSFSSEGPLEDVMARKEEAAGRALQDMADELAASIIYQR